jgi:mercuric ion transport protein
MREEWLATAGLTAALGASTCCVLPVAFGAAGLGGAWLSYLSVLAPYRIPFQLAAIGLVGAGLWLVYARRPAGNVAACAVTTPRRLTKSLLWSAAAVLGLVLTSNWWTPIVA